MGARGYGVRSEPGLYSKRGPQMMRKVPRGMRLAVLPESHVANGLLGGGRGEQEWLRVEWWPDSGRCTTLGRQWVPSVELLSKKLRICRRCVS